MFHPVWLASLLAVTASAAAAPAPAGELEQVFATLKARAAEKSSDLRIARATDAQRDAQVFSSIARWLPRLDLQLTQSRQRNFDIITSGSLGPLGSTLFSPQAVTLSQAALNLTVPLYKRTVHLGIEQSLAERLVADEDFRQRTTELDWRLRTLLGNYLLRAYQEATIQNSVEIARANLKEAELRFSLGQRTRVDVLRSKANLVSLESKQLSFREQKVTELNQFQEYSGLSREDLHAAGFDGLFRTEDEIVAAIDGFARVEDALGALAPYLGDGPSPPPLDERITAASPVYAGYLAQEKLENVRARNLMAQEFPELMLQGSLNKQAPDWNQAFASANRSYSAALVLTIPLFSGGSTIATLLEKRHADEATLLRHEKDALHFRNEVENERTRILTLTRTAEAGRLSLDQNEEIVRLSTKSYQLGKATIVELLGSQNDLIDAKTNLAKAKLDLSSVVRQFAWNLGVNLE